MSALPSLRQLQYLLALSETLSFGRAAKMCHVTQSTLSAGIRDLEAILGQPVVERTSRRVSLSGFGRDILPYARATVEQAEKLIDQARARRVPLTGALRLGVIPTIAPYLLPDILPSLRKDYPHLDLHLREDMSARLVSALDRNDIDAALIALPYDTLGMEHMDLFSEPFVLVRADHAAPLPARIALSALKNQTILLLEDGHCLRDHAREACQLQEQSTKKGFSATSLPTLLQMVQHGYGHTLLPAMAARAGLLPAGLEIHEFTAPQPTRTIGLIWRQNSARGAEFRLLGRHIAANVDHG
ncbi:hydrogen peroxide-inducible genes activator [Micavibrio aeruginosavorus]|uniref:hydrogen peroxide-inducible genes activator n=1 Tax=Micavibrio aeruginosavorus TaxID=349221 RepID=UPI003F4AF7B5